MLANEDMVFRVKKHIITAIWGNKSFPGFPPPNRRLDFSWQNSRKY